MLKVFLDSNIILEVLLKRSHHRPASQVLTAGEHHQINLFTSSSIIGFVAYWLIKDLGLRSTKIALNDLLGFIHCIDLSHDQLLNSLQADFKDIEDGMQYFTALEHRLDYFVTFNKKDFRKAIGSVKIVSPDELMKIIT